MSSAIAEFFVELRVGCYDEIFASPFLLYAQQLEIVRLLHKDITRVEYPYHSALFVLTFAAKLVGPYLLCAFACEHSFLHRQDHSVNPFLSDEQQFFADQHFQSHSLLDRFEVLFPSVIDSLNNLKQVEIPDLLYPPA